jgi:hypothetical protein
MSLEARAITSRPPSDSQPAAAVKPRRRHRQARPQLLTRAELDGRTNAAKAFDALVSSIEADLGGRSELSTIELALVEAFAGAAVTMQHLNTQLALGQPIDLGEHAHVVGAMVRVASRLGLARRARDITTSSDDERILRLFEAEAAEDNTEEEEAGSAEDNTEEAEAEDNTEEAST